jgi:hypothetical protein
MVDLYNNSAPDQQEAIHQFFLKNYNRQLDVILETPAHDLKLPESLNLTFETKIENGETFLYSEVEQQWMNEAKLQQLYRVVINFRGSANPDLLIATAPTAVQAIAFATLYAQNSTGKRPGDRITIRTDNGDIANADLKAISGGTQIQPLCDENVKLVWDLPKVGVSTGHYKAVRDNLVSLIENCNPKLRDGLEQEHREMCRLIHACASDTPESFTKAVLSAERALGVQWIKAQLLEDALGL